MINHLITQADIPLSPPDGFRGWGPLGLEGKQAFLADFVFSKFLSSVIGLLSIIAIIWFVFLLISGGIGFMTSGADKAQIEASRKKIVSGLIGLVITIFGIFVIKFIGYLIGIPNILNIPDLLYNITK